MAVFWEWVRQHDTLLWWLGGISLVTFLGSLIIIPILIVRIPEDFFMPHYEPDEPTLHPIKHALAGLGKNILGVVVFLAGFAMLFIPGQGLLTMLLGLALIDFPGKREMELRLLRMPKINRVITWVRRKYGRKPLQLP